jgi:hypothetical protein
MTAHGSRAEFMGMSGTIVAATMDTTFAYKLLTAVTIAVVSTVLAKLVEKLFK